MAHHVARFVYDQQAIVLINHPRFDLFERDHADFSRRDLSRPSTRQPRIITQRRDAASRCRIEAHVTTFLSRKRAKTIAANRAARGLDNLETKKVETLFFQPGTTRLRRASTA